jgi:hypothetical protein
MMNVLKSNAVFNSYSSQKKWNLNGDFPSDIQTRSYAQTNIQLFNQLHCNRYYSDTDLKSICNAYSFARKLFAGLVRGSGKPFMCHLVGTASILASLNAPIQVVTAGLLHASYIYGQLATTEEDRFPNAKKQLSLTDTAFYLVHDEPLLQYLGVKADIQRFKPTLYTSEDSLRELAKVKTAAAAANRNRISVLLANKEIDRTLTVTHTLWAMLGVLPQNAVQLPHRHQSVALDLILDCDPGCYTLVGTSIADTGEIINPTKVEWQPYSVFITPPGYWHAHYNESASEAHLIPMQDAGLQTYLRTLDIKFGR